MTAKRIYRKWNDPPTLICKGCGCEFQPFLRDYGGKNHGFYYEQKYCTKGCANKSRPRKTWLDKHGYPQMTVGGRGVPIHRVVMERMLGRKLHPDETVHHKDGDRTNYAESNLELWSGRHGRGQRANDQHDDLFDAMVIEPTGLEAQEMVVNY